MCCRNLLVLAPDAISFSSNLATLHCEKARARFFYRQLNPIQYSACTSAIYSKSARCRYFQFLKTTLDLNSVFGTVLCSLTFILIIYHMLCFCCALAPRTTRLWCMTHGDDVSVRSQAQEVLTCTVTPSYATRFWFWFWFYEFDFANYATETLLFMFIWGVRSSLRQYSTVLYAYTKITPTQFLVYPSTQLHAYSNQSHSESDFGKSLNSGTSVDMLCLLEHKLHLQCSRTYHYLNRRLRSNLRPNFVGTPPPRERKNAWRGGVPLTSLSASSLALAALRMSTSGMRRMRGGYRTTLYSTLDKIWCCSARNG